MMHKGKLAIATLAASVDFLCRNISLCRNSYFQWQFAG